MVGFGHFLLGRHFATVFESRIFQISLGRRFATVFDGRFLSHFAWKQNCQRDWWLDVETFRLGEIQLTGLMEIFATFRLEDILLPCLMVVFCYISLGRLFTTVFYCRIFKFRWKTFCSRVWWKDFITFRLDETLLTRLVVGFWNILRGTNPTTVFVGNSNLSLGRHFATMFDGRIWLHFAWMRFWNHVGS